MSGPAPWWDDPAFWRDMAPVMFDDARFARAKEEVDGAVALLGLAPGARVLDLCCGPGRHAIELAGRGFRVTGVDLNEAYLAEARASDAPVEWVRSDMRAFRRDGAFDGAMSVYSSIGYFEDPAEDLKTFQSVRASLRPGARFLVDTMCKEVLAAKFQPRRWWRNERGWTLLEETEILDGWRRVRSTWTLIRGTETVQHAFGTWLYSGSELASLLAKGGFGGVDLFGWFDGRPFGPDAKRLVAVARA